MLRLELGIGPQLPASKLDACALAVINPPWQFEEAMREALPWIAAALGSAAWARVVAPPASVSAPARAK